MPFVIVLQLNAVLRGGGKDTVLRTALLMVVAVRRLICVVMVMEVTLVMMFNCLLF